LFYLFHILIAIERSQFDLAAAEQSEEQQHDGILPWKTRLRLRAPAELLVDALEGVRRTQRLPLRAWKAQKGEELVAGLLQALHHRRAAQLPLLGEPRALLFNGCDRLAVDHAAVVLGELFSQPRWRLRLQVPQLVRRTPLNLDAGPIRAERRRQPRIAVDDRQHGPRHVTGRETGDDLGPTGGTLFADQPQVEHHALAVATDAQRHQDRHALAAAADADLRIPPIHEHIPDVFVRQIPGAPGLEVLPQSSNQSRDRILRERPVLQQRGPRPS